MRVSSVLHHPDGSRQNLAAAVPTFTPTGDTPVMSAVRDLLEASSAARQRGDHGVANMLEHDATLLLRAAVRASTPEGQRRG